MSRTKTSSNRSQNPFSSTNHSGGYHKGSLTASTHRSRQLPKLIYRVMQRSSPPFRNAGGKPPCLSLKVPSISLELTHQCSHLRPGTLTWAGQQSCFLFPPQWSAHRLEIPRTQETNQPGTPEISVLRGPADCGPTTRHASLGCERGKRVGCWQNWKRNKPGGPNAAPTLCPKGHTCAAISRRALTVHRRAGTSGKLKAGPGQGRRHGFKPSRNGRDASPVGNAP